MHWMIVVISRFAICTPIFYYYKYLLSKQWNSSSDAWDLMCWLSPNQQDIIC